MRRLFIDLEGTVIDDLCACVPLDNGIARVRALIERWQPDNIQTFSWAFWTAEDLEKWPHLAVWLEQELGCVVALQDFEVLSQRREFLRAMIGHFAPGEEVDFCGLATKERVFEWFIRQTFERGHFILIDDRVPDKAICLNNGSLVIEMVNIAADRQLLPRAWAERRNIHAGFAGSI